MVELKSEIRMWIAEKLLNWSFDITPYNQEGQKIRRCISLYYIDKIKENPELLKDRINKHN